MKKVFVVLMALILCSCTNNKTVDLEKINNFDYSQNEELGYDVHCQEYLLLRVSDFTVLNSKDTDKVIFPASLTKILTLDTVLHHVEDLNERSSINQQQVNYLIEQDASLACIHVDYQYTIEDLLYALILPSGADGAVALENYFSSQGKDLVEEMNNLATELGCENSNFVNTTGLHDDNHYTTLDDLLKILMDTLSYEKGREILEALRHKTEDEIFLTSSLRILNQADAKVLGGKTGYTPESGQSVIVLFKKDNRSYILMVANAMGDYSLNQYWHYEDAMEIIDNLY